MAIKKSQLYTKLWQACDELRGGMDASQYKDYVLVVLFIKYISDRAKNGDADLYIDLPQGCAFDDLVALKGKADIGERMNVILARIGEANEQLADTITNADFADEQKLGKGKDLVETVSNLIGVFQDKDLDLSNNRAADDDLIGDAYEYLMKNFATQSGKSKGQFYTPGEVSRVMARVVNIAEDKRLEVKIFSFAYKKGIPVDTTGNGGGFVFDCRAINNPGKYEHYRQFTGLDQEVVKFLEDDGGVIRFLENVYSLVDTHVKRFIERKFTNMQVCFGCTGGQHRSVYCAERLARHLSDRFDIKITLSHRELDIERIL